MRTQTHYINHYFIKLGKDVSTGITLELTCTGLYALRPCVISVSVGRTSAALEPRTAGSATTDLAGFLEGAAL